MRIKGGRNTAVSFIIPTYNEEKFLPQTLSSIRQFFFQSDYEVIIVDNGSTDSTLQIAQEFGATILQDPLKTIAGLRNLGALYASGNILVFLDADVIITREWGINISRVITNFEDNRRFITGSRCGVSKDPTWIEKYWFAPMIYEKANYINSGHLIIHRDIFHEIGGFHDALITGEDWEFCIRAKKNGIMVVNNPDLCVIHQGYPKTLRQFIRREKWHGIQDFYNIESFIKSKPAILAVFYWIIWIIGITLSIYHKSAIYFLAAIIINSIVCMTATLNKRKQFSLNIPFYFLLYNVYFFSRGLSLIEKLCDK